MFSRFLSLIFQIAIFFSLVASPYSLAIDPIEFESDKDLKRYQSLLAELRCPKCQNQNLEDSDSQISDDLRREVARLVKEGKNDEDVRAFMVARYGDFILYKPPFQSNTIILWLAPGLMMGMGVMVFGLIVWQRAKLANRELSDDSLEDAAEDASQAEKDAEKV